MPVHLFFVVCYCFLFWIVCVLSNSAIMKSDLLRSVLTGRVLQRASAYKVLLLTVFFLLDGCRLLRAVAGGLLSLCSFPFLQG